MSPQTPNDPNDLSLTPSKSAGTGTGTAPGKPDFSDVQGHADTVPGGSGGGGGMGGRPDFSDVQGHADTVPGGSGGGAGGLASSPHPAAKMPAAHTEVTKRRRRRDRMGPSWRR